MKNRVLYIILAILVIALVGLYIYGKSQTQTPLVETNLENQNSIVPVNQANQANQANNAPANAAANQNANTNTNSNSNAANSNAAANSNKNSNASTNANSNGAANNSSADESQGHYSNELDLGAPQSQSTNANSTDY